MDNARITIALTQRERATLMELAQTELHSDREQARHILRQKPIRHELLSAKSQREAQRDRTEIEQNIAQK